MKVPRPDIDPKVPTVHIRYEPGTAAENYDAEAFVKVEVPAGAAVLLHGAVVHKSNENTGSKSRYVYAFHCVESFNTRYSPENWLQMPDGVPFTKVNAGW